MRGERVRGEGWVRGGERRGEGCGGSGGLADGGLEYPPAFTCLA